MDPYLEARWTNVHVLMMGAITAALNAELPQGLEAKPEEEIRVVQIVDARDDNRVVTVIEVFSPWNKLAGRLNRNYVRKLHDLESAGTNWVEINLLRSTREHLPVTWEYPPEAERADYLITTYRADDEKVSVYPIRLRDPLPVVRIPLRDSQENVTLQMQKMLDRIYVEGRFGSIDYSKPLVPPLSPKNTAWMASPLTVDR